MFGNFKRDSLLVALNSVIKENIHPGLQVISKFSSRLSYNVCLEGLKRVDDLKDFFCLPIDPSSPDIITDFKAKYFVDGKFMFADLADAVAGISRIWKSELKGPLKFKFWMTGSIRQPYAYKNHDHYYCTDNVSMAIALSNVSAIAHDKYFYLRISQPDEGRKYKLFSWIGKSYDVPKQSDDPIGVFSHFVEGRKHAKIRHQALCNVVAENLKDKVSVVDLSVFLMNNPAALNAAIKKFNKNNAWGI